MSREDGWDTTSAFQLFFTPRMPSETHHVSSENLWLAAGDGYPVVSSRY